MNKIHKLRSQARHRASLVIRLDTRLGMILSLVQKSSKNGADRANVNMQKDSISNLSEKNNLKAMLSPKHKKDC